MVHFTQKNVAGWKEARGRAERVFNNPAKPMLLFFGMQDRTDGRDPLNPYALKRAGFSGARNLMVDGAPVRVPSQYNMKKAKDSPFVFEGKCIRDTVAGGEWSALAPTIDLSGSGIRELLPTMSGTVGVMVFPGCANFDKKAQCQFCIAGGSGGKSLQAQTG